MFYLGLIKKDNLSNNNTYILHIYKKFMMMEFKKGFKIILTSSHLKEIGQNIKSIKPQDP